MAGSTGRGALRVVPPYAEPSPYPTTLPALVDPIVNRIKEIDCGISLVDAGTRLLTITGPGGVGKTRFAIELATRLSGSFGGAVVFVSLTPLADPQLVLPAVAAAAGFETAGDRLAADVIADGIGATRTLLVLDNAEHVLASIGDVVGLLGRCPSLHLVVTSRIATRAPGEMAVILEPLAVPGPSVRSGSDLVGVDSVELFVREVRRFRPGYAVDPAEVQAVAEICRRLDGLPLAIELAAARTRVLAPAELVRLLGERLGVLRSSLRDAPPHQQTLRAAIDWSYQLVEPADRQLFRALGVFAGGFTFDAVASVTGTDRFDVLDQLERLVAHHLVRVGDADGACKRFDLFESIREFANAELESAGEATAVRDAHASWVTTFVSDCAQLLTGAQQADALARLDRELDNVRAALVWVVRERDDDAGLLLAASLWRYWWTRGWMTEGRTWLDLVIAAYRGPASVELAAACQACGDLAEEQGEPATAQHLLQRAVEILERLDDELALADAWNSLGISARSLGDLTRAESLHQKAHDVFRGHGESHRAMRALSSLGAVAYYRGDLAVAAERWRDVVDNLRCIGDRRSLVAMLGNLASVLLWRGELDEAILLYEEGLAVARELGDTMGVLSSLGNIGGALVSAGELDRGVELLNESLAMARETGAGHTEAVTLHALGRAAHAAGDQRRAGERWVEALEVFRRIGFTPGFAGCLESFAGLAVEDGRPADAVSFFAAALAIRERDGSSPENDQGEVERDTVAAERAVPAGDVPDLRAVGAAWTADEAAAAAGTIVAGLPDAPAQRPERSSEIVAAAKRVGLTARELEIVGHLVARRTDQEIAQELFISTRTVTTHVSSVLRKLGVSSRREVAQAADRLGLTA